MALHYFAREHTTTVADTAPSGTAGRRTLVPCGEWIWLKRDLTSVTAEVTCPGCKAFLERLGQ